MAKKSKKMKDEGTDAEKEELKEEEEAEELEKEEVEDVKEDTEEDVESDEGEEAEVVGEPAEGGEGESAKPRRSKEKKAVKKRKSRKEKENPLARALRLAVETGTVEFGAKNGLKDSLLAKSKLLVVASNAPRELQDDIAYYSKLSAVPVLTFDGTSIELGSICGKPYPVSVLSIYDAGSSDIMEIIKKK